MQGDTENANYRNSVRFSCRFQNNILSGPQEITCNERGEWSGQVPKCKGTAASLKPLTVCLWRKVFQSVFRVTGGLDWILTSGLMFLASTEVICTQPNIPHGYIMRAANEYKQNDFLHYECLPKYQKTDLRLPKCTNLLTEADWIPKPECEGAFWLEFFTAGFWCVTLTDASSFHALLYKWNATMCFLLNVLPL